MWQNSLDNNGASKIPTKLVNTRTGYGKRSLPLEYCEFCEFKKSRVLSLPSRLLATECKLGKTVYFRGRHLSEVTGEKRGTRVCVLARQDTSYRYDSSIGLI